MSPRHFTLPLLSFLLACGGAQTASEPELTPEAFYPLAEGNVWTYDVDTGSGPPTLGVTRVVASLGARHSVSNNGSDPIEYEYRPQGIRRVIDGVWILRWPLSVGASWEAQGGREARIVQTEQTVETPSGSFPHCVVVEESGGAAQRQIRTTYCPGVGMVALDTAMQTMRELVVVRARLRAYDIRPAGTAAPEEQP